MPPPPPFSLIALPSFSPFFFLSSPSFSLYFSSLCVVQPRKFKTQEIYNFHHTKLLEQVKNLEKCLEKGAKGPFSTKKRRSPERHKEIERELGCRFASCFPSFSVSPTFKPRKFVSTYNSPKKIAKKDLKLHALCKSKKTNLSLSQTSREKNLNTIKTTYKQIPTSIHKNHIPTKQMKEKMRKRGF